MRRLTLAVALLALPLAGCLGTQEPPATTEPPTPSVPALAYLPPVDLMCPTEGVSQVQDAVFGSCGAFGEPVIEVAGDGAVWTSATCCVGRSPPIWVSRDGAQSFSLLPFADRTGAVRDAFGIEGDFAMDDVGNVYFFDISAATTWFSKYQADGTHVFTKADAFPPLVDRPWVRAGAPDEVWVFYNTGSATNLFHSTDGGMTWTLTPVGFGCALMTIGQGPERDRLFVAGCAGEPKLWLSEDGGATFGDPIALPTPEGDFPDGTGMDPLFAPVSDAAGNIYVFFEHFVEEGSADVGLWLDVVHADGSVTGPRRMDDGVGTHVSHKPWPAAGGAGRVAVAWYGTTAEPKADGSLPEDAPWHLYAAASVGADRPDATWQVVRADPEPVLEGAFGRELGDFLQSDIGPDGRHYIIYARRDGELTNRVVVSDGILPFGAGVPANGPRS